MECVNQTYTFNTKNTIEEISSELIGILQLGQISKIILKKETLCLSLVPTKIKDITDYRINKKICSKDITLKELYEQVILFIKEGEELVEFSFESDNVILVFGKEKIKEEKLLAELPYSLYNLKKNQFLSKYEQLGYTIDEIYPIGEYDIIKFKMKKASKY